MVANHFPENSLMGVIWRVPARGIFHSLLYYPWVFLRMWMQQQAAIFWNSAIKWKTPSPVESAPYEEGTFLKYRLWYRRRLSVQIRGCWCDTCFRVAVGHPAFKALPLKRRPSRSSRFLYSSAPELSSSLNLVTRDDLH